MSDDIDAFFSKKKATKKKKNVCSVDVLNRKIKETNMRQQQEDAEAAEAEERALNENGRSANEGKRGGGVDDDDEWLSPTTDAIDTIEIETKGLRVVNDATYTAPVEEEILDTSNNDDDENSQVDADKAVKGPAWKIPAADAVTPEVEAAPIPAEPEKPSGGGKYVPPSAAAGGAYKAVGPNRAAKTVNINDVELFPTLGAADEMAEEQKLKEKEEEKKLAAAKEKKIQEGKSVWGAKAKAGVKVDLMKEELPATQPTGGAATLSTNPHAYRPPVGGSSGGGMSSMMNRDRDRPSYQPAHSRPAGMGAAPSVGSGASSDGDNWRSAAAPLRPAAAPAVAPAPAAPEAAAAAPKPGGYVPPHLRSATEK